MGYDDGGQQKPWQQDQHIEQASDLNAVPSPVPPAMSSAEIPAVLTYFGLTSSGSSRAPLEKTNDPSAQPLIATPFEAINDPSSQSRRADLLSALPLIPSQPRLARRFEGARDPSDISVEQLLARLEQRDWPIRVSAIRQLERLRVETAIAPLLAALHDEHVAVRAAAARALGHLGETVPLTPLVEALSDPEWLVRAAAVGALGKQHLSAPVEPLLAALRDEDESVRLAATKAVGLLGERAPLASLTAALHDPAWSVREAAVYALGEMDPHLSAEPLLMASHDEDVTVREAAERMLAQNHPQLFASALDELLSSSQPDEKSAIQTGELVWSPAPTHVLNELAAVQPWYRDVHSEDDEPVAARAQSGASDREEFPEGVSLVRQPRWSGRNARSRSKAKRAATTRSRLPRIFGRALAAVLVLGIGLAWLTLGRNTQTTTGTFFRYPSHTGGISNIAWSTPTASNQVEQIAFSEADGMVQVYDIASGQFIKDYGPYHVLAMTWSITGLRIASLEKSGMIQLYQPDNTTAPALMKKAIPLSPGVQPLVAWSADGMRVAVAFDKTVQVWDTTNQQMISHTGLAAVTALAWSHDGTVIASAYDDGKNRNIEIWDALTGLSRTPAEEPYQAVGFRVVAMAWSPAGSNARLAYTLSDGDVQIWDRTLGTTFSLNRADPDLVSGSPDKRLQAAIAWSPDGQRLASTTPTGIIEVWDSIHGNQLYSYTHHTQQINALTWSSDGKHIASVSVDGLLLVWGAI